jgi:small subunit ribosomal protein S17
MPRRRKKEETEQTPVEAVEEIVPAVEEPAAEPSAPQSRASSPKPARAAADLPPRGNRREYRGVVVSDAMDKTVVVRVDTIKMHPRYKKVIRRSKRYHAHDERNEASLGDVVRIVESRPVSKSKSFRLVEVVEAAK